MSYRRIWVLIEDDLIAFAERQADALPGFTVEDYVTGIVSMELLRQRKAAAERSDPNHPEHHGWLRAIEEDPGGGLWPEFVIEDEVEGEEPGDWTNPDEDIPF